MRVIFLASYFPRPSIPLTGVWALEQAKALAAQAEMEVICCTPWVPRLFASLPEARPWIDVPPVHRWGNVLVRYFKTLYYPVAPFNAWAFPDPSFQMEVAWRSVRARLFRAVEDFKPDVIFCHHTAVNGYFANKLNARFGLPYVITDHSFEEIAECENHPRRRSFFESILRRASRHICVSRRMEGDARRLFPFSATETLHNGFNLPSTEAREARPASLQDKLVVFTAAMFAERKGIPALVAAFARVANRHPNAILRIAGDGTQRPEIEKAIREHRVEGRVFLLGLLPHKEVLREMESCDLFALISWDEPFATVYLEAMGIGKPVIACTDSGIADVVSDGVQGFLVEPRNIDAAATAIERLLASPSERCRMGENGRRLVRDHLSWETNTRRLFQIFRECLGADPLVANS